MSPAISYGLLIENLCDKLLSQLTTKDTIIRKPMLRWTLMVWTMYANQMVLKVYENAKIGHRYCAANIRAHHNLHGVVYLSLTRSSSHDGIIIHQSNPKFHDNTMLLETRLRQDIIQHQGQNRHFFRLKLTTICTCET